MAEKGMPELDQITDRLFSISPKDQPFFQKQLAELVKTEAGSRLLRSLSTHFAGPKIALKTKKDMEDRGYFSDDKSELVIRWFGSTLANIFPFRPSRETTGEYSKTLLHELTHWEQYQNQANAEHLKNEEDRYFTVLMAEADAQASGDLFQMEQKPATSLGGWLFNPAQQMLNLVTAKFNPQKRFVTNTTDNLRKEHPEWSEEQIKKEARKLYFKKVIMDKDSVWRRFYEDPANREKFGLLKSDLRYSPKEFPTVMAYYMEKYGLTLDECRAMKAEILAQSDQKFSAREIPSAKVSTQTNSQMLSQASDQSKCHQTTPPPRHTPNSQKLNPTIVSHLDNIDR